jgi:hypothetical protein
MLTRIICAVLVVSVAATSLPTPVHAQFGIKRAFKKVVRAPLRVLPKAAIIAAPLVVFGGPFRGVFGVVAAVAVGAVIFGHLSKYERREVSRRAKVVVAKDPDQKVTDTYTSKDGKKQVTITAEPTQKAADLKNDPAILVASDTVVAPDKKDAANPPTGLASDGSKKSDAPPVGLPPADGPATPAGTALPPDVKVAPEGTQTAEAKPNPAPVTDAKPAQKPVVDEEVVRISEIPPDTQCRRVTTELELRMKKGQEKADEVNTNTAIFCQTAPGEWKPAAA